MTIRMRVFLLLFVVFELHVLIIFYSLNTRSSINSCYRDLMRYKIDEKTSTRLHIYSMTCQSWLRQKVDIETRVYQQQIVYQQIHQQQTTL